jgi:hypothetical protein
MGIKTVLRIGGVKFFHKEIAGGLGNDGSGSDRVTRRVAFDDGGIRVGILVVIISVN